MYKRQEEDGGSGNSGTSGGSGSSNGFGSSDRTETSGGSKVSGLPSYVVHGTWGLNAEGSWTFLDDSGRFYKNCWAAIYNPYADPAQGQSSFDWFCFDENGSMRTGWFQDPDGSYYYLNSASDGTRGKMLTGWHWIPDGSGLRKCYYFNPASDGTRGKMPVSYTHLDVYKRQAVWSAAHCFGESTGRSLVFVTPGLGTLVKQMTARLMAASPA